MKNRIPIIALWLLSVAGTFAIAWSIKPGAGSGAADAEAEDGVRLNARLGTSSGPRSAKSADTDAVIPGYESNPTHLAHYIQGGTISPENMEQAIKDMRKENDPLKKQAMFSQLLTQLTPENAKAAFLAIREGGDRRFGRGGGGFGGGDEERLLLNAWGRVDGAGAIAELKSIEEARRAEREAAGEANADGGNNRGPGGRGGPGGFGGGGFGGFDISSVLNGWATADASGAMAYVNGIEDDRMKGMLTGSVIRGLMVNGVDDAVAFISSLPADDENRGRHMWSVAEEVLEDGAASAARWVSGLTDDSLKAGAMGRIAESYARENLDEAIAWVRQVEGEDYARSAVTQIAERWARTDPQAVIEWAGTLPDETQRGVFVQALDEWTGRDAVAASEYLAGMETSPARDSAVQGFVNQLSRQDPESAATWAGTISDEALRAETLARVARDWVRTDRAAAEAWLPTSGLSEEQQQQATADGGRGFDPRGGGGRPGGGTAGGPGRGR